MEPITTGAIIAGATAIAGSAMNAYQTRKERKRQQKLDDYNKELAERNYQQQELYNSPSYQKQRLMEAGYNPLVSGDSPSMNSASPQSPISNNPLPTNTIGDSIIKSMGDFANTLLTEKQREIDLQGLEVEQKKISMEKYKIETQKLLSVAEKAVQLYHNNSITKDQLNEILSVLNISVNGNSLTADEILSRIKVNEQTIAESKQREALLQTDNVYRDEYNRLVNKKLESEINKTQVDTTYTRNQFDIQELQKKQMDLVNYKMECENYFATLDNVVKSIKPDGLLPPNIQIQVAQFLAENHKSIISNLHNDFINNLKNKEYIEYKEEWRRKNRRGEKVKIPYKRNSYDDYTESLKELGELQQKAINGELQENEYWYLRYLLSASSKIATIATQK